MAIAVCCQHCDAQYRVKDEYAGKRVKCQKCGTVIYNLVPTVSVGMMQYGRSASSIDHRL